MGDTDGGGGQTINVNDTVQTTKTGNANVSHHPNSATFVVGTAGSFTVTVAGFPKPTLSDSGTLPSEVTFNVTTGVLSGTPAAGTGGTYLITFTASNGVGSNASQNFTLTVH